MTNSQRDQALLFHSLHTNDPVLILANAWDVASARIVEAAGASAIATTSAGVAWSLGYPDGDQLDRDRAIDLVARIAAAVQRPVTADIESGYARQADGVGDSVTGFLEAGAVGINLEDAHHGGSAPLRDTADQAERIAAARAAADSAGIALFINARTDTYLRSVGDPDQRLDETLERAAAYLAAGASGVFVPGVSDPNVISALANGIAAPLNVLVGPGSPTTDELAGLGVARVSAGSSIAAAAYGLARRSVEELLTSGTYDSLAGEFGYGELNALLRRG
jgi:2-methylisocitrate lyase-like PEP mutase family enzyme